MENPWYVYDVITLKTPGLSKTPGFVVETRGKGT